MTPGAADDVRESPLRAEGGLGCVVCGPRNPHGLHLRFDVVRGGTAVADWTPTADWEGFDGIIHGGIVCTVLDEAMSKTVAAAGWQALTAELRVRFRRHLEPGAQYAIRGWVVERQKRKIQTEAALTGADGNEFAHAWGTFLMLAVPPADAARDLRERQIAT